MNKLFKYILVGIGITSILFASCNAVEEFNNTQLGNDNNFSISILRNVTGPITYTNPGGGIVCYTVDSDGYDLATITDGINTLSMDGRNSRSEAKLYCSTTASQTITITPSGKRDFFRVRIPEWYIKQEYPDFTSSQCQQEYNLIPISAVDKNYCESNNLCTVCNDTTGEINTGTNWSSLFLNGTQINSNAIIDIYADDRLNTEVEYLNDTVDINITQNIDTSYIEEIKNNEKITPTNEDVEYMIQGLQVYIPYIFIGIIIVYTLYLIKKFFRG